MKKNDGGPAFPLAGTINGRVADIHGMSLRDYFAGQAMAGLDFRDQRNHQVLAERVWAIADAMLAAREAK